ncbi:MAG: hypothetical protein DME22_00340 [Verrucomicrobia bacterium]|nr:MAG: hypothetical protein DME22_00340 [Verrucomicrobiota bacterium]
MLALSNMQTYLLPDDKINRTRTQIVTHRTLDETDILWALKCLEVKIGEKEIPNAEANGINKIIQIELPEIW